MTIAIDISQISYEGTGVGRHVENLVRELVKIDKANSYILFGYSLRNQRVLHTYIKELKNINPNVEGKIVPLPQTFFRFLWNTLHIFPVTWILGAVDVYWSSDWIQPPLGTSKGVTTIHDLSFFIYPKHFDQTIVRVQKRRLSWAFRECCCFFCDSQATKQDVMKQFSIEEGRLHVVYPGGGSNDHSN